MGRGVQARSSWGGRCRVPALTQESTVPVAHQLRQGNGVGEQRESGTVLGSLGAQSQMFLGEKVAAAMASAQGKARELGQSLCGAQPQAQFFLFLCWLWNFW